MTHVFKHFAQGMYGDKAATLQRFRGNYQTKLSGEIQERLVLENDEVSPPWSSSLPVLTALQDVLQC